MPRKSTIDLIVCMKQTVEKYRENIRGLCMKFINLEKTCTRVPRKILKWALIKKGIQWEAVETIEGAKIGVRSVCREMKDFRITISVR